MAEILKSIESAAEEVFVDVVYYHDVDDEDYDDHLERRSRGFVAFLRPSIHPIQDDLDVNFEAKKQDVPKIRNPNLDYPSFSDAILVTSSLEKGEAYKRDTNRLLVNTLFKVNNSKSDNIKEFELASLTARVTSHH